MLFSIIACSASVSVAGAPPAQQSNAMPNNANTAGELTVPVPDAGPLQHALAPHRLRRPAAAAALLSAMGLDSPQELALLGEVDWVELLGELKAGGLVLGDRAKIQLLSGDMLPPQGCGAPWGPVLSASSAPGRRTQENGATMVEAPRGPAPEGTGLSGRVEIIAIMVTVLLGLASYLVQAKIARDAAHAEKDHDRAIGTRERERHVAGLLLERVRTQMTDVYRPLTVACVAADAARLYMARELGFEWLQLRSFDSCFIRPSERLYPHLEVMFRDYPPEIWKHALEARGAT